MNRSTHKTTLLVKLPKMAAYKAGPYSDLELADEFGLSPDQIDRLDEGGIVNTHRLGHPKTKPNRTGRFLNVFEFAIAHGF